MSGEIQSMRAELNAHMDKDHDKIEREIGELQHGQERIIHAIAGEPHEDITGEVYYRGGVTGDIGEMQLAIKRLEAKESNGGVNAKVNLTKKQKVGLWIVAIPVVGRTLLELLAWLREALG